MSYLLSNSLIWGKHANPLKPWDWAVNPFGEVRIVGQGAKSPDSTIVALDGRIARPHDEEEEAKDHWETEFCHCRAVWRSSFLDDSAKNGFCSVLRSSTQILYVLFDMISNRFQTIFNLCFLSLLPFWRVDV